MKEIKNLFFLFFLVNSMFSQEKSKQNKKMQLADKLFNSYAFVDSRDIYLSLIKKDSLNTDLLKKIGDSYYLNSDYDNSSYWYRKLFNVETNLLEDEYIFKFGMSLKATLSINEYNKELKNLESYFSEVKEGEALITKSKFRSILSTNESSYQVYKTSFNSEYSEIPSFYYNNKLYFSSNKEISGSKNVHKWNNKPFYDIYTSNLSSDLEFLNIGRPINTTFHESSPFISKDGLTIYFSRNNFSKKEFKKNKGKENKLKIYKATRLDIDAPWENIKELPFNSDSYNCSTPALNESETKLYFSTDMPGTMGMSDIFYVSIKRDSIYSKPRSVGKHINTSKRESFPFIKNEKLYFSSDGHYGFGGLDIFTINMNKTKGKRSEVINLGRPINSSKDDFSFFYKSNDDNGFFCSNRKGGLGDDDIYKFKEKNKVVTSCNQYLEGIIKSKKTGYPLINVKVFLMNRNGSIKNLTYTDSNGFYSFNIDCKYKYYVVAKKLLYCSASAIFSTNDEYEFVNNINLNLDRIIPKEEELTLLKKDTLNVQKDSVPITDEKVIKLKAKDVIVGVDLAKLLDLEKIHFEYDKADIRKEDEKQLLKVVQLLNKFSELKIEIRSHTDIRGGSVYNVILSDKRAQSTRNYLISKGIPSSRIKAKGYGDFFLINKCNGEVDCLDEEHLENRRSEFIVIK